MVKSTVPPHVTHRLATRWSGYGAAAHWSYPYLFLKSRFWPSRKRSSVFQTASSEIPLLQANHPDGDTVYSIQIQYRVCLVQTNFLVLSFVFILYSLDVKNLACFLLWPTTQAPNENFPLVLPKMVLNVGFNHSQVAFYYSCGGICFSLPRSSLNLRFSIVEFLSWIHGVNLLERATLQTIFDSCIPTQKKF